MVAFKAIQNGLFVFNYIVDKRLPALPVIRQLVKTQPRKQGVI